MYRNVTPPSAQPAHPLEQARHLAPFQFRRRLVENDEPRTLEERPGDLHDVPLLNGQTRRVERDIDFQAPLFEHPFRAPPQCRPAYPGLRDGWMRVEEQILRDRQSRYHRRLLIHAGDPLAPPYPVGKARRVLPFQPNPPVVRSNQPGQRTNQRRLAGPVAANEGTRITRWNRNRDLLQGLARAKVL